MRAHFAAVKDRLEEHSGLAGKVFDSARLDEHGAYVRANYLILFGGAPDELGADRLHRSQAVDDNAVFDYTVRAVGISADAVRMLLEASAEQLVGWTPQISGRYCRPLRWFPSSGHPRMDETVRPPLFFADEEYELRSFFRSGS